VKRFFYIFIFGIVICSGFRQNSFGQNLSTEGDDFWVGFLQNWDVGSNNPIILEIYISANDSTRARIEMPLKSAFQTVDTLVLPDRTLRLEIPTYLGMSTPANSSQNGIHITTDKDVSIYAMNKRQYSADMAVILPTYALGNEYVVVSHWEDGNRNENRNSDSEFLIVGIEDNTIIEIIPSHVTRDSRPAGVAYQVSLNRGETHFVKATGDLTGTKIHAVANTESECKKFAVFAGNMYTKVGECDHPDGHDHLYAQMYPTYTWGKEYITADFNTRKGGDHVKVIASEDDSQIFLNGDYVRTLQSGEFLFLKELQGVNYISSDKIISVAQFSRSQACDNTTGDPFIILINPNEQVLKKITFFTPSIATLRNFNLSIIARSSDVSTVTLDGTNISGFFNYVPYDSTYSYAKISIYSGNHTLRSTEGVIAYVYAYGSNESFGYPTGAGLTNLNLNIKVLDSEGEDIPIDSICHHTQVWFKPDTEFEFSSYQWDFGDGTIVTRDNADSVAHTYEKPGKYIVEVTGTSGGEGCVSGAEQKSVKVIRVLHPKVNIFGPRSICPNTTDVQYTIKEKGQYHLNWFVSGGLINDEMDKDSISVDWGASNDQAWLKALVWNDRGCIGDTVTKPIKIKVQLDPEAPFGPDTLCSNNIQNIAYETFFTNGSTFDWHIDLGEIVGGQGDHNVNVNWDSWGSGMIWFEQHSVTDTVCSGISDTLAVYIQRNPNDFLNIITDKTRYGIEEPIQFDLETDTLYNVVSWTFDTERYLDSVSIQADPLITYNCPGVYEVTAIAYDTMGVCHVFSGAKIDFEIFGPEIEIIQVSHEDMVPNNLVIKWKYSEGDFYNKPFYLFRDNILIDSISTAELIIADSSVVSDSLIYRYEIMTNEDCKDHILAAYHTNILLNVHFEEGNEENADLGWNQYENWKQGVELHELYMSIDGGEFTHIENLSAGQLSYTFTSNDLGFEHCFLVKAVESGGNDAYSWSNISCITFIPELYPYNIITPNGDDKNDTFHIDNIEHYPNAELTIFNRWGKKVYQTRQYQNNWGGMHNGEILPNSTYYYVLELNEPRSPDKNINGTVSILK
jgi:gliding motility-associated-like protein